MRDGIAFSTMRNVCFQRDQETPGVLRVEGPEKFFKWWN